MRKIKARKRNLNDELPFRPVFMAHGQILMEFLRRHTVSVSIVSYIFYGCIVLLFGKFLGISSNYFVIFPVLVISMGFGFWGGLISGTFALPSNLFFFYFLGHPEFSPESKLIAELSGIIIGAAAGYVSDYFYRFQQELERRKAVEAKLRSALQDKEILLQEVHHRVKNNLTMITSLARLHVRRVDDERFGAECEGFIQRVHSISLVHDLLYPGNVEESLLFGDYVSRLSENLLSTYPVGALCFTLDIPKEHSLVSRKYAVPVGMIINELLTNALKHAFPGIANPELHVSVRLLEEEPGYAELVVRDNGIGHNSGPAETGLGWKLIPLLTDQISGSFSIKSVKDVPPCGTVCRLTFAVE